MVSHVVQAVAIPGAHGTLITSRVGNDGQGSTGKMEGPAKTPISLQPRARPLEHMKCFSVRGSIDTAENSAKVIVTNSLLPRSEWPGPMQ